MRRILNAGCGNDFYGTDRIDIFKTKATTKVWDINKGLPYKNNTFIEIKAQNILEHLENIGFFLRECKRVLKKGSILKLSTDNAAYPIFHLLKRAIHGNYSFQGIQRKRDIHFYLFTPEHLRNWCERIGFKIEKIEYWNPYNNTFKRKLLILFFKFLPKRFRNPHIILEAKK